jgi:hypothetical protein
VWEGWEAGFMAFHAFHTLSFPRRVFACASYARIAGLKRISELLNSPSSVL